MRNLGRAAAAVAMVGMAAALVGCAEGAQSEHLGEGQSFVIFDRAAREAGFQLDGVSIADAVLPIEVSPASRQELVGPGGRTPLQIEADEVVYVRGANARVEHAALEHEVARDRVTVIGSEGAARALADDVGGVVDDRDGRLVVVGPDALAGLARAGIPAELEEVVPVMPGDAEGRPAFGNSLFSSHLAAGQRETLRQAVPARQAFDVSAFVKARMVEPSDDLLPEVVDCADPIVGTWVSREHYPEFHDWYRFELNVTRDANDPTRLRGVIRSRSWSGDAQLSLPTTCSSEEEGGFDWTVRMVALGTVDGQKVSFDGRTRHHESTRCGERYDVSRYNLDHFNGQLIENGRFLTAVNNDGDRAVDEPHVFRRVSCH